MLRWIIILLLACVDNKIVNGDATDEFKTLAGQFWTWRVKEWPEISRLTGTHPEIFDEIGSFNLTVFPVRKAKADEFLQRLRSIRREDLSTDDVNNYDALLEMLQVYTDGYRWFKYSAINPVSYAIGEHVNMNGILRGPRKTKVDFENLLSRLMSMKTRLAEYTSMFREAIRLNRTLHRVSVDKIPGQIDKLLVADPSQLDLFKYVNDSLALTSDLSDEEKSEIRQRAVQVIEEDVIQPFREFKIFMENEYMPRTRRIPGVWSWDNGREFYAACLKYYQLSDVTAEQVHQKGLEEVARIRDKMMKIIRSQNFQGTIAEYFTSLRAQERFHLATVEDIIDEYTDIINNRINTKLHLMFNLLPEDPVRVKAMSYDGSAGSYRYGVFYPNVMRPNNTLTYDMMSLALHEANPGHHLQITYNPELQKKLPAYRVIRYRKFTEVPFTFPGYGVYVEGWALYAEALGEEMGVYKDEFELMGRYSREMLRACRLVVDTGLHHMGWTREDAVLYIMNYTSYARQEVEHQVNRYITWPGQATGYKIGELKIWELRHKAENELGKDFNIKEFHDTILNVRPVSLRILERAVDQMIARVKDKLSVASRQQFSSCLIVIVTFIFLRF